MFDLNFKIDVEGLEEFAKKVKKQCGKRVVCGIPEDEQYEDGTSVAEVALINEYGLVSGTKEIPPRPFMSETLRSNKQKYMRMMNKGLGSIVNGGTIDKTLVDVGRELEQDMKLMIDRWSPSDPRSNSAETMKEKQKETGNGQQVLIDTGKMRDSVKWWIENNNSRNV